MKIAKSSRKKIIIVSLVGLLLVGVPVGAYFYFKPAPEKNGTSEPKISPPKPSTKKYPGPTDQEKQQTEQHKDDLSKQNDATQPAASDLKSVTPVISSADQTGVRAFISGIFENSGTCTFTYAQGAANFTKTSQASADASTTICYVTTASSDFPSSGSWSVTLSYSSDKSKGISVAKDFEVK